MIGAAAAIATWGPTVYYTGQLFLMGLSPTYLVLKSKKPITLKEEFPAIYEKIDNLREDILICHTEDNNLVELAALGSQIGPHAVIRYKHKLSISESDPALFNFILKHEVSHIYHNDTLIIPSLGIVAATIAALSVPIIASSLPFWISPLAYMLPTLAGGNVAQSALYLAELRADRFACQHSENEEVEATERHLNSYLEVCREVGHKERPELFSEIGELRLSIRGGDPTVVERIQFIRNELRRRNPFRKQMPSEENSELMQKSRELSLKIYDNTFRKKPKAD